MPFPNEFAHTKRWRRVWWLRLSNHACMFGREECIDCILLLLGQRPLPYGTILRTRLQIDIMSNTSIRRKYRRGVFRDPICKFLEQRIETICLIFSCSELSFVPHEIRLQSSDLSVLHLVPAICYIRISWTIGPHNAWGYCLLHNTGRLMADSLTMVSDRSGRSNLPSII